MPYIPQTARKRIDRFIEHTALNTDTPGELNYAITRLCLLYMTRHVPYVHYADRAEVIGALECAKLEFYRTALADYEDAKAKQHGPVSGWTGRVEVEL